MPEEDIPEPYQGAGTILTEKRRRLLLEGDLEELADSTIRRHKQAIRERLVDALVDLNILAVSLERGDLKSLADTVSKREEGLEQPIFHSGLTSLVALGWLLNDGDKDKIESAVGDGVQLGEERRVPYKGKIPLVHPGVAIEFGPRSVYRDPDIPQIKEEYQEHPEWFGREASALMEATLRGQ